jgi:hypothetical protein
MDVTLIIGIVAAVFLLVAALGLGRMAWRLWRGDEELEPGGSMGRQMFGRSKSSE